MRVLSPSVISLPLQAFLAACLLLLSCSAELVRADDWQAGAAKIEITPTTPMWMSGYGNRDHVAEGTLTPLWAKALILQDPDGARGCVISLDLVGIDRQLSLDICRALEDKFDLQRHQIAICNSHTHTGPAVGKNLAPLHYYLISPTQQRLVDKYSAGLVEKVAEVVGTALGQLEPSQLSWGSGHTNFAVNRRNNRESQVRELRLAKTLKGPFDHDVPVLAVHNAEGRLTSVLFGYACHATVLSFYQWSGDYPGFAQAALEENHEGCVALFFAGCGADQNPLPRRSVELARHYGRRLANAVDAVLLTTQMQPITGRLKMSFQEIPLPLGQLPSREEIEKNAQSSNKFEASRARMLLRQLEDGPLSTTYPYPIGVWQLGNEVEFVTLGGEVVVDYAVRLKTLLNGTQTWVAGYAHDVMAYIPSRRVLREGGYEGASSMIYYGLPTIWSPALEDAIVQSVSDKSQHQAKQ